MSDNLPAEEQPEAAESYFDTVGRPAPRAARPLIAGAAALAVLGGGALGFLWLGSTPQADASSFSVPAPAGGSGGGASPTTAAPQTDAAFAPSGHDAFTALASSGASSQGLTGPTAGTASGAGTGATSSPTAVGVPGKGTTTIPVVPVTTTTQRPATGGTPARPAPVKTVPAPPTPTPSVSTAPAWEVASYRYTGVPQEGKTGNFVVATTAARAGYIETLAVGDKLYPADLTFQGDFGGSAWISSDRGVPQGWLVPSGQDVPPAALGKTTGTVRVVGLLADDVYFVQVDRGPSLQVKVGDKVEGTPFTLEKPLLTGVTLGANAVVFKDGSGISYYGASGAGETDGVSF